MNHSRKAIVIGAGIAGIASAIRLANKGFEVSVLEANVYPGGKLSEFAIQGYRFDAGPSLFTLPELVEELFAISGKNPAADFEYIRLEEMCKYFWEDGTQLTAWADKEKFAAEAEQKLGEPKEKVLQFLQKSADKYDITERLFLKRSLHKTATWFNKDALKGYLNVHKLEVFRTMNDANEKTFQNPKTVQLFNRYATYNGSDPYQTPATLNIIPHLEYNIGAFFPKKGMFDITKSLVKLAESLGVNFVFNTKVEAIGVANGKITGVETATGFMPAECVLSNMDVVNTYRKLLPDQAQPEKLLAQPKSTSALIFYWGIKKTFPQLGLHNIFFSEDYKHEFAKLFQEKTIADDPTVYINITSKHKPDDAPEGCENWFTMINVPNNSGQNWDELITQAHKNIIEKLSRMLQTDISQLIDTEVILDPRMIEIKTSSWQGALYGNSSNNRYAAFLRHPNFSKKIKNLYFVGGSVHPGGGIPLALSSAKIATDMLDVSNF
ncbi:MAG: phytoene desaturase [Verrucomicrobia bacterium]|nr:phytoene desaturase [Cytophagales bacterium]